MKYESFFFLTIVVLFGVLPAGAQNTWPKDIATSDGGKITVYEPQPESFSGNKLTGRAAVSLRKSDADEPVFGAIFFTATMSTDKSSRMADLESMTITNAKFSGLKDQAEVDKLATLIQKDAPSWNLSLSIDDLVSSIKQDNASKNNDRFQNDAPNIIYASKPTTLVVLDGAPQVQNDKNLNADKVVNSPNLIFKEGNQWNMYAGGIWYKSTAIASGWKQNTSLSAKVKTVNEQVKKQENENNDGKKITDAPKVTAIIVATEPTELLQTDGEPDYKTVKGTALLYIDNSPNEIFKDINSQKTYVLIAGRWYNSPGMSGPWTYIASDKLPADFAKIPDGSDKDGVLSNVAGTDAAEEAKIDAEIPQTAKVDRRTATVSVQYDGPPQFHTIEGTSLQLAENTNLTVMIDPSGNYFALDNGVWFIANGPNGPWSVANDRPRDVDNIPASSPAYNSKYVYIYDQTPDYVYTGYTSGYLGSYIYGPTIVYGTGYRYRPWHQNFYYPRPVTWGYGFNYNPWYGWSMNWGYNFGFLYVGFNNGNNYGGGWFGPPRYNPPYRPPYWSGGGYYGRDSGPRPAFGGGNRPGGNRPVSGISRPNVGSRPGSGWVNTNNLYNNHRGVVTRDIDRRVMARPSEIGARPNPGSNNRLPGNNNNRLPTGNNSTALPGNNNRLPGNNGNNRLPGNNNTTLPGNNNRLPVNPPVRDNNVLTDRQGNIYKRDQQNNSWQTRDNRTRNWKPVTNDNNNSLPDLNRQQHSRERSETRQSNFGRDAAPVITRPATSARPAIMDRTPAEQSRPAQAPSGNNRGGGGRPERR
jgi:hypothetical protein